ncbi:aspartate kinase [Erysipelothrix sp. HDW6A]|nr:aspartate kinase [Erysipelothrix sp. HDW6A]QIK58294.1 aspartate kinase [Erysipelothrix sp. HDW6A]
MLKVAKFGGSSVANAEQFQKVKEIVLSDKSRSIIVTSASGKSDQNDSKLTDLLYLLYEHYKYGVDAEMIIDKISGKLSSIQKELNLSSKLMDEFSDYVESISSRTHLDEIVSRGEYFTAKLLSEYLSYYFVDAKDLIIFNYDLSLNYQAMEERLYKVLRDTPKIVVPGFYGSLPNGDIKIMDRGGSDITGSILANLSNASCYENWTDVSGILKADPRIINNPKQIDVITYDELRELSYMGASVLHEEAIFPVKEKNIPIQILNTNDPTNKGTTILNTVETERKQEITGIAGKKDFSIITIFKAHMSNERGTLLAALRVLDTYQLRVEHIPTGIDMFSLVIETKHLENSLYEVLGKLQEACNSDRIDVVHEISLIAVVSRFMKQKTGMSGRLFGSLGSKGINISLISQTSDESNIIVGVNNEDYDKTIQTIYHEFEGGVA